MRKRWELSRNWLRKSKRGYKLGFAGALRRSELVVLTTLDVAFVDYGMTLTVRRSKTDQQGQGRTIGMPWARGTVCPITALHTASTECALWILPQLPDAPVTQYYVGISGCAASFQERLTSQSPGKMRSMKAVVTRLDYWAFPGCQ